MDSLKAYSALATNPAWQQEVERMRNLIAAKTDPSNLIKQFSNREAMLSDIVEANTYQRLIRRIEQEANKERADNH